MKKAFRRQSMAVSKNHMRDFMCMLWKER
jgi:hypothetical protein